MVNFVSRAFWTHLVLPLAGVFAVAIVIHTFWTADGFFLNLATELVGILITICYVEWILRQHNNHEWKPTDARIANRLRVLLNAIVSSVRGGLGYGPDVLNQRVMETCDVIACHKEVIRVGEHIIAPSIHQRVRSLDAEGWKSLARQITHVHNGTLVFLNAFQNRLTPKQISLLLDIQDGLSHSLTYYSTFPDLMGIPTDQLPEMKSSAEELQYFGCESSANELQKVLLSARQLSATIDENEN